LALDDRTRRRVVRRGDEQPKEQPDYERQIAAARAALGDDVAAFERAVREGRAMKVEHAIKDALDGKA
jgi:hypothetical protein